MSRTLLRFTTVLMLTALLFGSLSLVSCADDTPEGPGNTPTPTATTEPTGEIEEPIVTRIPLDLPEKDFGGAEFHVAEWSAGGATEPGTPWIPWEEIDVDTMDGDLLGEAVYARNNAVEEKYKVDITKEYISVDQGYFNKVTLNDMTGDDAWAMITLRSIELAQYISAHLMADLNDLPELGLDKEWWVTDSVNSLTLGEHLYFAASEMLMRDKGATSCVYFNKKIASDNSITDLYSLVDSGDWTLEALTTYGELVATSLDGDDLLNSDKDMWGWINNAGGNGIFYLMINGMGQKYGIINDDGEFEFAYNTRDCVEVIQTFMEDFMFADEAFDNERGIGGCNDLFRNDLCLFYPDLLRTTTTELRQMETDYGILPCPKADDLQDDYSSLVFHHHSSVLGIPAVVADKEMAATITEALSWESYYTVYPQFYDTILMSRNVRDEESKNSLTRIFDTRSFDCGLYYHGTMTSIQDMIYQDQRAKVCNIASIMETCADQIEKMVETINGWIVEE